MHKQVGTRAQERMRNMSRLEPALTSVGILNHLVV